MTERKRASKSDSHTQREREKQRDRERGALAEREQDTETETESFTTVFCCKCSAVYPGLLPAIRRVQATSGLEKNTSHCLA